MSAAERLASFFLAPADEAPPAAPVLREVPPPPPDPPRLRPVPRQEPSGEPAPGVPSTGAVVGAAPARRVAVVGGGRRGAGLAAAVAAALARAQGSRCALLVTLAWDGLAPVQGGFKAGPPTPAARRLARALAGVSDPDPATLRGRVVQLHLEASDLSTLEQLEALQDAAAGVPVVLALPGVRESALDPILARQDRLLVAVDAGAPAALGLLATAELRALAPGAVVRAVPLPARLGVAARRAAVAAALEDA